MSTHYTAVLVLRCVPHGECLALLFASQAIVIGLHVVCHFIQCPLRTYKDVYACSSFIVSCIVSRTFCLERLPCNFLSSLVGCHTLASGAGVGITQHQRGVA